MTNRRNFLKTTAAFAAGSMVLPMISCTKEKVIGLQLYTVRDKINLDFEGTLNRLVEMGYNSIESADYIVTDGTFYRLKPKAFADKLKALGMPLHSCHIGFELDTAEKVFADAAETGTKYVIYPYLPAEMRTNIYGYKATA